MTQRASDQIKESLFSEFTDASYEDWYQAVVKSLKGKPFEKLITQTYEGIELKPLYGQEDIENLTFPHTLPGEFPYVRGTKSDGYKNQAWLIAQEMNIDDPKELNAVLKHDLTRGQTAINITAPQWKSLEDVKIAFADIDLAQYPLFIQADHNAMVITNWLNSYLKSQASEGKLKGCIGYDPLHGLGTKAEVLKASFDKMAGFTQWAMKSVPQLDTIAIHTDIYHEAGANALQELAIALATGVTYIREMQDRDLEIDTIAGNMRFFFSIGNNFFMEIAKFRAARLLWAQIVQAFGGNEDSQKMKIHARTGKLNKTKLDPHVNMLRVTSEAMAGAIGGVGSISVSPFDEPYSPADDFSRRIVRNVQLILQEEVNLVNLIDPAGGSWYVESLTDQLAQSAWELFQKIEKHGGMVKALQEGFIQEQIKEIAKERIENIATRKDVLVGTSMYNLPDASILEAPQTIQLATEPSGLNAIRLAEPFEQLRSNAEIFREQNGHPPRIFLVNIGDFSQYKARMDFAIGFYEVGGFELLDQGGFASIEAAIEATLNSGAWAIVICSTDELYVDLVPQFTEVIKTYQPDIVVILAGYPTDKIEDYRAAGVDDFIHIRANCYEKNRDLQKKLGVGI